VACSYLLSYDEKCFELIAEDILKKQFIYKTYLKVILESFYKLNYCPSRNFNDMISFFGNEVLKRNSLDGITNVILILILADHQNETDLVKIFLDDFHKIKKIREKKEKTKKIENPRNFYMILKYFQAKYQPIPEIMSFLQENKEYLHNKFSSTMSFSLNAIF